MSFHGHDTSAIVNDVCYDFFGQRVATCSSDNMIRVFDARSGHKQAEWRAHAGSIHRLTWAHPEFGVALASCSFDRKICVWEETTDSEELVVDDGSLPRVTPWLKVAEIGDAMDTVVDVQFAPHHMGVRLASCGADGIVRVHEAADVLDLSKWEVHSEMDASAAASEAASEVRDAAAKKAKKEGASGGGAGGSRGGPLMSKAQLTSSRSKEQLPARPGDAGGGAGLAPPSGGGGGGGLGGAGGDALGLADTGATPEPLCLAWSTAIAESPMIIVGISDGSVQLWLYEERRGVWQRSRAFDGAHPGGRIHLDCVRTISWAADMGRSYQLIATGSRDRTVKLWALQRTPRPVASSSLPTLPTEAAGGADQQPDGEWSASCCADLPHRCQVWRVSWNAAGSMLASSEDDGNVRVHQMDSAGGWRHAAPLAVPIPAR